MGITPDNLREMQARLEKSHHKPPAQAPNAVAEWPWPILPLKEFVLHEFNFVGLPVGKPRMTRSDKFRKRPCVLRYRAFADALRAAAVAAVGELPREADVLLVSAYIPMPASWSLKKKESLKGQPCRQKPDWDNIGKAVGDVLFKEDACIWLGLTIKFWCESGAEGLNVKVLYAK